MYKERQDWKKWSENWKFKTKKEEKKSKSRRCHIWKEEFNEWICGLIAYLDIDERKIVNVKLCHKIYI